jgi:hypothetical protein
VITSTISLASLVAAFPTSWYERYVPNPIVAHIPQVFDELVAEEIISPQTKSFAGFSGVPRYFHPFVGKEGLIISLELMCWFFYFDDPFDHDDIADVAEGERIVARTIEVLNTGELPLDPTPIERLCERFRSRALQMGADRPDAAQRFIAACADWVGSIMPINRRQYRVLPSLADYKAIRLVNVGIFPQYPLDEIVSELTLEASFVEMPEIIELGKIAVWIVALCNDIYSYESESKHATQMNSLELRKIHNNLSLSAAYEQQVAEIKQEIDRFVALENFLIDRGILGNFELLGNDESSCHQLDRTKYINGIRSIIMGNHFWSLNDGRYSSPNSPFLELRTQI